MIERYLVQGSTFAGDIDGIITLIALIVGFWFILAELLLVGLVVRFRRRDGDGAQYVTGESWSQMRWVVIPLALIVLCDIFIALQDGAVWTKVKENLPEGGRVVRVIGQQWAWTFVHPGSDGEIGTADDIAMNDELHLEVDTLYHYKLESRDVLHNFSVPIFRLKQDAIPGRVITGWFQPTTTGTYDIQCAEICGIGHGMMPARAIIESPTEHAAWMQSHASVAIAAAAVEE